LILIAVATSFAFQSRSRPAEARSEEERPEWDPMREFAGPDPPQGARGRVGKWTTCSGCGKSRKPASFDAGTAEVRWILGERYLEVDYDGTILREPFQGVGHTGFDNLKQKYVSTWIDNAGTGISHSEGTFDAATQSITYAGECPDTNEWKYVECRTVEKQIDADHWAQQMYTAGPDGREFLCVDITYTRAK
jgi:hypothetical protein